MKISTPDVAFARLHLVCEHKGTIGQVRLDDLRAILRDHSRLMGKMQEINEPLEWDMPT